MKNHTTEKAANKKAATSHHINAAINALEEGLPDFVAEPMIKALNAAAKRAGISERVPFPLTTDRYEYSTIAAIIKAEAVHA